MISSICLAFEQAGCRRAVSCAQPTMHGGSQPVPVILDAQRVARIGAIERDVVANV
jgi:hypothetical protein